MKKSIILSLAALVFIVISSFLVKTGIQIQTVQTIDAPQSEVYELVRSFDRFSDWSPFNVLNPELVDHVTGTDGQIGSTYHWEGITKEGESLGKQTLMEFKENSYVLTQVDIEKPQKSNANFEYLITANNGKTIVTQNFTIHCNGFEKFMMSLFGVEKEMTEVNALGMDRLKELAEKETALANN